MTAHRPGPPHIVVGVDGSDGARSAVRWAAELARRTDYHVDAVHAISPWIGWEFAIVPFDMDEYRTVARRSMIEDWCIPFAGLPHEVYIEEADAARALIEVADEIDPRLVVLGAHGHGRFSGKLLGSVTAKVAHTSHRPVVVVPHDAPPAFDRLLAGVDGSEGSIAALRWAATWARELGASVYAVCVLPMEPYDRRPLLADWEQPDQVAATLHGLRQLAQRIAAETGCTIHSDVLLGHAGGELVDLARQSADAVIVGSRGLGGFQEVVFGSTSRTVATHSSKAVVIVPHPEDKAV